jgi:hypothetical protein
VPRRGVVLDPPRQVVARLLDREESRLLIFGVLSLGAHVTELVALTRTTSAEGDIGVREETREGTLVYILGTLGSDQYVLRSREKSVAQAIRFAKREHVRA